MKLKTNALAYLNINTTQFVRNLTYQLSTRTQNKVLMMHYTCLKL